MTRASRGSRRERLELIRRLISAEGIATQGQLAARLSASGIRCTQASLSRDLAFMGIKKRRGAGGCRCYTLPERSGGETALQHSAGEGRGVTYGKLNGRGAIEVRVSGNLAVVKTRPGHAPSVAADIDNNAGQGCILGTVAGDDTVFVALCWGTEAAEALSAITSAVAGVGEQDEEVKDQQGGEGQ